MKLQAFECGEVFPLAHQHAVDMTAGMPYRGIIRFALPILAGSLFQQLYNMADIFIVSRTLGVEAFAGVSSTGSIGGLITGFALGMTSGLSIVLAQAMSRTSRSSTCTI